MAELLPQGEQQSISDLIRRVLNGLSSIVDRQIELAKQEFQENIYEALGASKTLAIGAGIGVVTALILLDLVVLIIVLGLNEVSGWLGIGKWLGWFVMLVIIVALAVAAYAFIRRGLREVRITPLGRTRDSLRESSDWVQSLLTHNER